MSEQVIAGVRDLLPVLRERAQDTEDARSVPEESVKALQETGFFKLLQPKLHGGFEADPVSFYTAVKLIASACGSTGWVASILGVHPWHVALFDAQAQQEVWGEDEDVRISSSYAPMGKAEVVDGGYRLSGRWSFSSGCDHCTWVLLGGPAFKDGKPVDGFIGAIPEPMVEEFIGTLLPSEADLEAREALEEELGGDLADAEAKYREALENDEKNRDARLGLGRVLAETDRVDEARQTLMPLLPDPDAERVLAGIEVRSWAHDATPGTLASAKRLAAKGQYREALDGMLGALGDDADARQAMIEVFTVLGDDDPIVAEYRRKLASALF
jgi:hypothetical protein